MTKIGSGRGGTLRWGPLIKQFPPLQNYTLTPALKSS